MKRILVGGAVMALVGAAPAQAEIVKLYCQFTKNPSGYIATVDYGARTLSLTLADSEGYPVRDEEQNMPVTISAQHIVARTKRGPMNAPFEVRFTIDRYSGVMAIEAWWQGYSRDETKPCVPHRAKPPRKQRF